MSALSIQPTYPIFTDIDGQPLEDGYVWIGTANLDPQVNPINVYWDAALTLPAAQPIRTLAGYPANSGTPARLYVNSDYSIRVMNRNGSAVYSAPSATERYGNGVVSGIDANNVLFTQAGVGAIQITLQQQLEQWVSLLQYDVVGDGVTDDTAAIQAAFDANPGKTVWAPKGQSYKVTQELLLQGSFVSEGATILPFGLNMSNGLNAVINKTAPGSIKGITIDGANCQSIQYGIFDDVGLVDQTDFNYYDVAIKNFSNSNNTQQCVGLLVYRASTATFNPSPKIDIKITVDGVVATSDGIIGNNGGAARGVLVSFNGNGTNGHVVVHDSIIDNVSSGGASPNEDADGIQFFQLDYQSFTGRGMWVVRDTQLSGCRKRAVKIQCVNAVVENVINDGDGCDAGFETYGINTTFRSCKNLNATGVAFSADFRRCTIVDCYAEIKAESRTVRVYSGADQTVIKNLRVLASATFGSQDWAIVDVDGNGQLTVDGLFVSGVTDTGSVFSVNGTVTFARIRASNVRVSGMDVLLYFPFTQGGNFYIENSDATVKGTAVSRSGNGPITLTVRDCTFVVTTTGPAVNANNSGGANAMVVDIQGCDIICPVHGIFAPDNSIMKDNVITSSGVTGYGMLAGNSVYRNNRINGYNYAIGIPFTTTAEVADNVSVGAGTGILETTGYTPFVNTDNFAR